MQKTEPTLTCVEINPAQTAQHSIIWLHGLGADGYDFVSMAEALNLPAEWAVRFVFPHAPLRPVSINQGYTMRAWYDIKSAEIDNHFDEENVLHSIRAIHALCNREIANGILPNKIVIGGFSQGALIALRSGLSFTAPLAGIAALSGYLPHAEQLLVQKPNHSVPVFIGHGTQDQVVPFVLGKITSEELQKASYSVSWHSYEGMAHSVCAKEIRDIRTWLEQIF